MAKKSKSPWTSPLRVPHVSNKKSLAHLTHKSNQAHEPVYQAFYTTAVQNVDRLHNLVHSHDAQLRRLDSLPLGDPDYAGLTAHVKALGMELLEVKDALRRDLAELAVYRAEDKKRYGEGLPGKEYRVTGLGVEGVYTQLATSPEEVVINYLDVFEAHGLLKVPPQGPRGTYYVETVGDNQAPIYIVQGARHAGYYAAYISGTKTKNEV